MLRRMFCLRRDCAGGDSDSETSRTRTIVFKFSEASEESRAATSRAATAPRVVLIAPAPALLSREMKRKFNRRFYEIPVDSDGDLTTGRFGNSDFVGCLLRRQVL